MTTNSAVARRTCSGGGRGRSLVAVVALGTLAAAAPACAQAADTTHRARDPLFTGRDALIAGGFVAATFAAAPIDRYFADWSQSDWLQRNRVLSGVSAVVREIAVPGAMIIGTSLYAGGRISGNRKMAELGLHGTEALLVGDMFAAVVKPIAGRARPYVDRRAPYNFKLMRGLRNVDYQSFPSGHSTTAFAAAAAVTAETARWWPQRTRWAVGPVMYGGAGLVAVSRMYNNKHWASDVIVGAAIGTFAGRKIVQYQHSHPGNSVDHALLSVSGAPSGEGRWAWRLSLGPLPLARP